MPSTLHTTIHSASTVAAATGRRWPALALALGVGALLALAMLVGVASPAAAAPAGQSNPCEFQGLDPDDTAPGANFDLTFNFSGDCAAPPGDITITLHEDIGVPSRLEEDQVRISAPGRFYPQYVDVGETDGGDHELTVAGCSGWQRSLSGDVVGCDDAGNLTQIRIIDLVLPNRPADDDDPYEVSIEWEGVESFSDNIVVVATLEVDGDDEVGYGETVQFEGSGFADGLSVYVYAQPGTSSALCDGSWQEIGSATVDRRGRFTVEVEITQSDFPSAEKYRVCARDGEGTTNGMTIFIEVEPGLEVAGGSDRQYVPGEEVLLRLVGGGNQRVDSVLVGGQVLEDDQWRISGGNVLVTLPASGAGQITILVNFVDNNSATVNVRMADIALNVAGYPTDVGVGLGQTVIVRANNLLGAQRVSSVTLDGVRLTFLVGTDQEETIDVTGAGRFVATVLIDDPDENRRALIRKLIDDSDGAAKLSIETDNGIKASAEVQLAAPTITVICPNGRECDEDNNIVKRGDTLVIRGENFPPDTNYYNAPDIEVVINDRDDDVDLTAGTSWQYEYDVPRRGEAGERLDIDVTIDGFSLRGIIDQGLSRLRIAFAELDASPEEVLIGAPITVKVSGLDGFAGGYSIRVRNGPPLVFDGDVEFSSNRAGEFTGTAIIDQDYHVEEVSNNLPKEARLELLRNNERVSGVSHAIVTLSPRYQPRHPDAPNSPIITADGAFSLAVNWEEPANDGGSRVTGYNLQYRIGSSGGFTDAGYSGAGTGHTITGLRQGTQYQVRVRASNGEGTGEWSRPGTGATEPLVASIEAAPGSESIQAGEPVRFRITISEDWSEAAPLIINLNDVFAGGFGIDGSGECEIVTGNICEYSVATSESQDSVSGYLTVEISPAPEYSVGTPSARVTIVNPAPPPSPTPTPAPEPTATPTPEPTPTPVPEPTDTPVPPPTVDRDAISATVVAAVVGSEAETVRDRPVAEDERGGGISPLAIALIIIAVVIVLAGIIGTVIWLILRRRRGSGGNNGNQEA